MNDGPDLAAGILGVLAGSGSDATAVEVVGIASAGATRTTVFIEILAGAKSTRAVAQLRSRDGLELAGAQTESQLLELARGAEMPVPAHLGSGYSESLDSEILITSQIDGETIPRRVLRLLANDHAAQTRLTDQCGAALARLHSMRLQHVVQSIPDLGAAVPAPDQVATQYLGQLSESLEDLGHSYPTFRYGISYLETVLPDPPDTAALVHGDFRNGNFIVDSDGLAAVLDWELAHLGDPMEDLAWLCLRFWRFGNDDLPVGGFGTVANLRDAYTHAGGVWREAAFNWWSMARTIWWGLGLAAQAKRFSEGESASIVHAASGRRVVELEYDLLKLIGESRGL